MSSSPPTNPESPDYTGTVTATRVYADTVHMGIGGFRGSNTMHPPTVTTWVSNPEYKAIMISVFGTLATRYKFSDSYYLLFDLDEIKTFILRDTTRDLAIKGDQFTVFDRVLLYKANAISWYIGAVPPEGAGVNIANSFGMMHYHTVAEPTVLIPACFFIDRDSTLWIVHVESTEPEVPDPTWVVELTQV